MAKTIKYRGEEATSGGEQGLAYQALVEKMQPKMNQSPGECCADPDNQETVGEYSKGADMGSRGWHGSHHHIKECRVCGRVHIPAPYFMA